MNYKDTIMITNLVITNIPKTKDSIKKILSIVRDHTWNECAVRLWVAANTHTIQYEPLYECYMQGKKSTLDVTSFRTYNQMIKGEF